MRRLPSLITRLGSRDAALDRQGGANVVYRILPAAEDPSSIQANTADLHSLRVEDGTTPPPTELELDPFTPSTLTSRDLHDNLLRVHKDVPWIPSYEVLYGSYRRLICPLFHESELVSYTLVRLHPATTAACNHALRTLESTADRHSRARPAARVGVYVSTTDPHGLLVEDMTADGAEDELLIELKPKWLGQSPNAPPDSKRCRTCAVRAMRAAKKRRAASAEPPSLCPLDLLSPDSAARDAFAARAVRHAAPSIPDAASLASALSDHMRTSRTLKRLRDLQRTLDPSGVLAIPPGREPSEDFLVATTLRDCTLFVKLRMDRAKGAVEVTAKLGDLDVKGAARGTGKLEHWTGVERELVEGGWYEARDGAIVGCLLERAAA